MKLFQVQCFSLDDESKVYLTVGHNHEEIMESIEVEGVWDSAIVDEINEVEGYGVILYEI